MRTLADKISNAPLPKGMYTQSCFDKLLCTLVSFDCWGWGCCCLGLLLLGVVVVGGWGCWGLHLVTRSLILEYLIFFLACLQKYGYGVAATYGVLSLLQVLVEAIGIELRYTFHTLYRAHHITIMTM